MCFHNHHSTSMHSSRMCTDYGSSHLGGGRGQTHPDRPPWADTLLSRHPLYTTSPSTPHPPLHHTPSTKHPLPSPCGQTNIFFREKITFASQSLITIFFSWIYFCNYYVLQRDEKSVECRGLDYVEIQEFDLRIKLIKVPEGMPIKSPLNFITSGDNKLFP